MEHLADEFIHERNRRGAVGPGRRIPGDLRLIAVRYARWKLEQGESLRSTAAQLEILPATLERWLQVPAPQEPTIHEVRIREELEPVPAAQLLSVITPDGFRIEGVEPEQIPSLLEVLR